MTPNDFTDLAEAERRLLCFQDRYQQTAAPIDWRFTPRRHGPAAPPLDEQQHRPAAA